MITQRRRWRAKGQSHNETMQVLLCYRRVRQRCHRLVDQEQPVQPTVGRIARKSL
jgi:hypothetical protein